MCVHSLFWDLEGSCIDLPLDMPAVLVDLFVYTWIGLSCQISMCSVDGMCLPKRSASVHLTVPACRLAVLLIVPALLAAGSFMYSYFHPPCLQSLY